MRKVVSTVLNSKAINFEHISFLTDVKGESVTEYGFSNCCPYYLSTDDDRHTFREFCLLLNSAPLKEGRRPVMVTLGESHARLARSWMSIPIVFVDISPEVNRATAFQLRCLEEADTPTVFSDRYFSNENPLVRQGYFKDRVGVPTPETIGIGVQVGPAVAPTFFVDVDLFQVDQVERLASFLEDKGFYPAGVNISNLPQYDVDGKAGCRLETSLPRLMMPETVVLAGNCRASWYMTWEASPLLRFHYISKQKMRQFSDFSSFQTVMAGSVSAASTTPFNPFHKI